MPSAAVRFHPAAAQEVESTYDWYAARDPAVAHGFREELRRAIETVTSNPRTWPLYGDRARRYVFPRYPFSLVYILRGDDVEVVAVAHGRRRPGYGDRDSNQPSNFRMQRTALRAAADPKR